MSSMAVLLNTFPFNLPKLKPVVLHRKPLKRTRRFDGCRRVFQGGKTSLLVFQFLKPPSFRIRSHQQGDVENNEATDHKDNEDEKVVVSEILNDSKSVHHNTDGSFLPKLGIALGLAFTITIFCIGFKGPGLRTPVGGLSLADSSSSSAIASSVGFTFKVFGYKFVLPEYAPGWVYFWLLMAAGCGLFISEEALNIWVGISLARLLTLDGTWHSFAGSLSKNAPYIISTIHWVYWGVCISDMVPFYLGKLFRQSGASEDVCSKLGIGKDKALSITKAVQRYGNLIGAVERFSIGVRNPTAFLAGALGISPECFFAGVCCGGLITLPVQLGIGFVLRERPVFALATVATVVGIWTVFPYAMAASTAVFLFFRRRSSF